MANIIESRVTLEDEVFEETIDTMEEPIEVVRPSSYNDLEDLPQVNGVTLMGNKTSEELGIVTATDIENAVSAEATLRENADTALGGRIDGEKTARENADTALGGRIDGEITNRTDADRALGTRIDNEILARQGGDNNLQTQIDAITSKSDVVDVVADYAALQAYDTQHLGNNDVIKVLDDETHNDAQTYYRWNKTAGTWSYIGSEAPYYSKGQIDQQMQAKQDKLTAGTGITLDGTTISADTTVLATKEDLEPEIVADLPTVGDTTKLYLTPTNKTASGNPITIDLKENVGQMTSFRLDGDTFQQTYTGKNLFDIATASDVWIKDTGISQPNDVWKNSDFIKVEPNTTYTMSGSTIEGGFKQFQYHEYSSNNESSYINQYAQINLVNSITFTTHTGCNFIRVGYRKDALKDVQLEAGSTATSYEPYVGGTASPNPSYPQAIQTVTGTQTISINGANYPINLGTIELCRISYSSNIFQDYIYKDGDDWKLHKATTTKRFSGADSEGWVINNSGTENFYYRCPRAATGTYGTPDNSRYLYCNYESGAQITTSNTTQGVFVLSGGDIRLRYGTEMSLDSWKAKLAATNMVLTYAIATPTDTVITDTDLISQLEAVKKATLANGQNTLTNTAVDTNLAGSMSIRYYGYNPSEYSEWLYIDGAWEQVGGRPFPTNISEFENDADFVSENELQDIIAPKLQSEIVNELPAQGDEGKLYLTPKEYTRGTGTGNPITAAITDEAGNMESFKLDGDTFQQSYTGKNLFNCILRNSVQSNLNLSFDYKTGYITISGTSNAEWVAITKNYNDEGIYLQDLPAGTQLSMNADIEGSGLVSVVVRVRNNSSPNTTTDDLSNSTPTKTLANDDNYMMLWIRTGGDGAVVNAKLRIQVTKSATPDQAYEPFVGGIPAPNPNYPQAIQTVTGEQTVEIVGKNLLDKSDQDMLLSGLYPDSSTIKPSGATESVVIPCYPETTYTVSKVASQRFQCCTTEVYPASGVSISDKITDNAATSITITTGANARYLVVYYYHQNYDTKTAQQILDTLQIELGSTATTYAPYHATNYPISLDAIELCKLGTYQDYIYKDGDDWKVHKATKKVELDEQSGWTKNQYGTNAYKVIAQDISTLQTTVCVASQFFTGVSYDGRTATTQNIVFADSQPGIQVSDRGISIRNTPWSDTTSLLAWVASNHIIVYYLLLTPTDTTITDQTLIAQLEAISTASLENGTNTISNSTPAPNLAGDMELGYYEYDPTNRYDKWLWLDLNNNYEKLGS